jgi:hypothetical protein
MDSPLFELKNSSDLFKKAKWNFSKLNQLINSYDLFDCLCTLNHVPDWIKNDPHSATLTSEVETIQRKPIVDATRKLCNRAKHFDAFAPKTNMQFGYGAGRYGVGAFGTGEPSYEVEVAGQTMGVLDLIQHVIQEWEKFFISHGFYDC